MNNKEGAENPSKHPYFHSVTACCFKPLTPQFRTYNKLPQKILHGEVDSPGLLCLLHRTRDGKQCILSEGKYQTLQGFLECGNWKQ